MKENSKIKKKLKLSISSSEIYAFSILGIYTFLAIFFFELVAYSYWLIFLNISLVSLIIGVNYYYKIIKPDSKYKILAQVIYAPIIYICYLQVQSYIKVLNPNDFDWLLIKADFWLFGLNPTQSLKQISYPVLTEYLQFAYVTFFFMPLIHAVELYKKNKEKEIKEFTSMMTFAFYLSFLAYFMLPAIGPRFTLHDFAKTSFELPGVLITEYLREFVNSGGGVPPGVSKPELFVNRDCFPSGHTMMTLLNIILAFRYNTKIRYVILVIGCSLIFSTIYLRYHYVIDVIFGIVFCFVVILIEPPIRKWISRINN